MEITCSRCGQTSYNTTGEYCVPCDYYRGLFTYEETVELGVTPWTPFERILTVASQAVTSTEQFIQRESAWSEAGWQATMQAQKLLDERRQRLYMARDLVNAYAMPRHSRTVAA